MANWISRVVCSIYNFHHAHFHRESEADKHFINATHLFEEPGTLEQVAVLASAWFLKQIGTKTGIIN